MAISESGFAESVATILNCQGEPVGVGFLVGESTILTCAHLVQIGGQEPVSSSVSNKPRLASLKSLELASVRATLSLVRSFSFVGEVGYDPERMYNPPSSG